MSSIRNELHAQSREAVTTAKEAVHSKAYLYPIQGIWYFVSHRNCWGPFVKALPPALALSVGVVVVMFTLTYLPQAAVMSIINFGPWGFISAVPLVLSESFIIFNTLSKAFILDVRTAEVFDRVLVERGHEALVQKGREVKGPGNTKTFGKVLMNPLQKFSPGAIAYYLLTLPLNFVPVLGTAVFFLLNGAKTGPGLHSRYFQLKQFSPASKAAHIKKHRGSYTGMGVSSLLLQFIPVINVFFAFTNAAGAALYASDLENGSKQALNEDVTQSARKEL